MSLDTRGNDPQRLLPQSVEDRLLGLLGFSGGIALLGATALAWVSLVSWSINDPSLTHATAASPRNMLGGLGAVVSDLMLQTFGLAAALALLPLMLWGAEMLTRGQLAMGRSKVGYYPIAVLALAGALSAYPVFPGWPLNHNLGGAIGDGVFSLAANLFELVNKDRADLAAALLLNICAIALFAKSTGFDLESWVKGILAERTLQNASSEAVDRSAQWLKGWRSRAQARAHAMPVPGPAEAHREFDEELALPYPQEDFVRAPEPVAWPGDGGAPQFAQAIGQLANCVQQQQEQIRMLVSKGIIGAQHISAPLGSPRCIAIRRNLCPLVFLRHPTASGLKNSVARTLTTVPMPRARKSLNASRPNRSHPRPSRPIQAQRRRRRQWRL